MSHRHGPDLVPVSELVTNCVRHVLITPDQLLRLTVTLRAETLRLELHDDGTDGTVAWRTPQQHNGGYGLDFVAQLSSAWGVERDAHGTTVWLELATRRLDKPAAPRPRTDRPNLRANRRGRGKPPMSKGHPVRAVSGEPNSRQPVISGRRRDLTRRAVWALTSNLSAAPS